MTRVLRPGDRVKIDGVYEGGVAGEWARVSVDTANSGTTVVVPAGAVTFVAPTEPPPGSVVIKDGVAWTRTTGVSGSLSTPWRSYTVGARSWDNLSDGEIVFIPEDSE